MYKKNFIEFTDDRGILVPIEFTELPFVPRRIFYVKDVPKNMIRGEHAHYLTKQLLICLSGEILVSTFNGKETDEVTIRSGESVFIDNMIWDYQKFLTDDDILLVLCSTNFDENDYIRDYEKFIKIMGKNNE